MTTHAEMRHVEQATYRPGALLRASLTAMALSSIANLALYGAVGLLVPSVTAWPGAGVGQIVGASCAYLFMGTILMALLARFSARPAQHFRFLATVGLLLSLALPVGAGFGYGAPGAPPAGLATVVTLSLMHVVAYAISLPLFTRQLQTK
ncbi:MAG: hypothetical protein KDE04_09640 [Anaerolineales bacterium]|nr:hypothetical protein [Anaerolineales bacterium]